MLTHRRSLVIALSAAGLAFLAPTNAHAQDGPRWRAWLGCWSSVAPASNTGSTATSEPAPLLCVTPTSDADVVEISAIADGKIVSRDRLDASGRAQVIDAGGCTGTTRANWSGDRSRVFLRSSVTCQGQPSETSAILAMAAGGGEWLDVRGVTAGGNSEVRVARYRDAGLPSAVPSELVSVLRDRDMSVRSARIASTAPVGAREIVEASRAADAPIVEAWLLESGHQFAVDAGTLRQLADAGVPGRVTDAMISTSRARESTERLASNDERVVERVVHVYDPWGYGNVYRRAPFPTTTVHYHPVYHYAPVGFHFSLFGFGYVPRGYAYAPFGYYPRVYRPVAYVPFGFGYGYSRPHSGRNYYQPVIVRPGRNRYDDDRTAQPRVVRDRGYTQGRAEPRSEPRNEPRYEPRRESAPRGAVDRSRSSEQSVWRNRTSEPTRAGRQERQPSQSQPSQPRQTNGGTRTAHARR